MAADDLAPGVARSSAAIILTHVESIKTTSMEDASTRVLEKIKNI